jgi:hypothetical protein
MDRSVLMNRSSAVIIILALLILIFGSYVLAGI